MPASQSKRRRSFVRAALLRPRVIVCGLVCLLIGEEWQRGYFYSTGVGVVWENGSQLHMGSGLGEMYVRAWRMGDGFTWKRRECLSIGCRRLLSRVPLRGPQPAWFAWHNSGPMPDGVGGFICDTGIVIPYWPFFWLALACTLWSLRRSYIRLSRDREVRCAKCDYDLTGNVSGICPECGNKIVSSVSKTPA